MQRRAFLEGAATAAAVAAGDVTTSERDSQQARLAELAARDDADRWTYETACNLAHVRSGLVNAELDALCEDPTGKLETYPARTNGIPLGFTVSTDADQSVGTLVHLTAAQAEALAVDLLEQAHAQRETTDA